MRQKLTTRLAKALEPAHSPYEVVDTELKGFLLRIQPSGVMSYYYRYRDSSGAQKRSLIGKHGSITVAQARDLAAALSLRTKGGEEVQATKKRNRADRLRAQQRTLGAFVDSRYESWSMSTHKSATVIWPDSGAPS